MASALEQPKRVTGGAFGRFLAEHRPALQKECAGKPATAVVKLASERFKALSDSEKSDWEKKYKDAQAQYEKDMGAFLAAGGEKAAIKRKSNDDNGASKKQKKDPEAPKRPAGGAFGCFLAKHRGTFTKECEGKPVTAISKLAGERWKELSAEDRKPFEEEYEAKFAAYQAAMKDYTPPVQTSADNESLQNVSGKTRQVKRKVATNEPATPKVEAAIATRAEKAGLNATLLKLLAHQEVIESGKSQADVLDALERSGGLLHPARRALLGA